ncbi:LuxR C-terminal-related transcriptional regulator [Streptomyces sp. NPDC006512]|uniref:LuxR C-terminal-related transcriptional regulator n=1 Tax=Streptomyces sp. NPDC006512 TaxID=3154307 RepID=UPI0033A54C29
MAQPSLEFLGLGPAEEALYRELLRRGTTEPGQLHATDDTLARVTELGLATKTLTGALRPAQPSRAVERLIENMVTRLQDELEEAARRQGILDSLLGEREPAPRAPVAAPHDAPAVQQIEGMDAVRSAIDELTFFARTENLTTNPYGILTPESIDISRPLDLRVLRRGVRMRTLMASPALDDPTTMAYLRELAAKGARIRISHQPLERMIICDRAAALTPMDPAHTAKGALLTREPGLVATLVALFERMWAMAQELPTQDTEQPTEIERRILRTLYNADKDETGARDLNISVRTYRKHIATLMQRLNAANRFQAALLAQEKGWL